MKVDHVQQNVNAATVARASVVPDDTVRVKLERERATITTRIHALQSDAWAMGGEDDGVPPSDYGRDLTISAVLERRLREIENALARLRDGTYGRCARCNQEIPRRRLEAMPDAVLCVACQAAEDQRGPRVRSRAVTGRVRTL